MTIHKVFENRVCCNGNHYAECHELGVTLARYLGQSVVIYKKKGRSITGIVSALPSWALHNSYFCSLCIHYLEILKWSSSSRVFPLSYVLSFLSSMVFRRPCLNVILEINTKLVIHSDQYKIVRYQFPFSWDRSCTTIAFCRVRFSFFLFGLIFLT